MNPYVTAGDVLDEVPSNQPNHQETNHGERVQSGISELSAGEYWGSSNQAYWRLDPVEPAHTVASRPNRFVHPREDRSLTMREYARLQSFPDDYEFAGSKLTVYDQIKNAVPVRVALALGRSLRLAL